MELKFSDNITVKYHDIFDFKLTKEEAFKWQYKQGLPSVEGKNQKSKKRLQREKYSKGKLVIAKNAARLISKIPTIKFIGITGALAMDNAGKNSDIDLIIITKEGSLWTTRLFVYLYISIFRIQRRKPKNRQQKDRLCLNMWLDESDLVWAEVDRNIYTAHEIAQIVPIVNKDKTYEKFLYLNKWILSYWPNSIKIGNLKLTEKLSKSRSFLENLAYKIQYWYMSKKITREIVTPTRAIFHPNDWGKVVMKKLST